MQRAAWSEIYSGDSGRLEGDEEETQKAQVVGDGAALYIPKTKKLDLTSVVSFLKRHSVPQPVTQFILSNKIRVKTMN